MANSSRITRSLDVAYPFLTNIAAYLNAGTPTTNAIRVGWLAPETIAFLALCTSTLDGIIPATQNSQALGAVCR